MNYRYFLTTPSGIISINPINSGRSKKYTLQNDGYYLEELNGDIILKGSEMSIIQSYEQSNKRLSVKIEEFISGVWTVYFIGYFFPWDCQFDLDVCTVTIKLKRDDIYSKMSEKMNERINVMDQLNTTNLTLEINHVGSSNYEQITEVLSDYYLPVGSVYVRDYSGSITALAKLEAVNSAEEVVYATSLLLGNDPTPSNLQQFAVFDPATKYVIKKIQITPEDFSAISWTYTGIGGLYYNANPIQCEVVITYVRYIVWVVGTPVSPGTNYILADTIVKQNTTLYKYARYAGIVGAGNSIKYRYRASQSTTLLNVNAYDEVWYITATADYLPDYDLSANKTIFQRFGSLRNVLTKLYRNVLGNSTAEIFSQLLFTPYSLTYTPAIDNIYKENPLNGERNKYAQRVMKMNVAGTQSMSLYRDILLIQNSDYKTPTSTERATIQQTSLKEMLDIVCALFNSKWFINSSNQLQIEHVLFFENNLSYNSVQTSGTVEDISNEVGVKVANKYSYDNNKLYDIARLNITNSGGIEFKGIDLVINAQTNTTDRNIKELTVGNVITDLDYIKENIGSIPDDGFVMVVAERDFYEIGGTNWNYKVINDVCPILGQINTNALLSASYLFQEFYTLGIPYSQAYVNGLLISTSKVLRNKKQSTLSIAKCSGNISPYTVYKTKLGYLTVVDMEHKMDDKTLIINGLIV